MCVCVCVCVCVCDEKGFIVGHLLTAQYLSSWRNHGKTVNQSIFRDTMGVHLSKHSRRGQKQQRAIHLGQSVEACNNAKNAN